MSQQNHPTSPPAWPPINGSGWRTSTWHTFDPREPHGWPDLRAYRPMPPYVRPDEPPRVPGRWLAAAVAAGVILLMLAAAGGFLAGWYMHPAGPVG